MDNRNANESNRINEIATYGSVDGAGLPIFPSKAEQVSSSGSATPIELNCAELAAKGSDDSRVNHYRSSNPRVSTSSGYRNPLLVRADGSGVCIDSEDHEWQRVYHQLRNPVCGKSLPLLRPLFLF
ncbi:hypothetical protein AYI69_g6048 [Smittium culicis]|uniref:Uncharacterized protein n=1 Tax=Smittium culicis TaxID=133412 RepID=A0A1R1Y2C2_9FUNG|nr:hypothetical protein AYI69_g6048 [Smittium culicis]